MIADAVSATAMAQTESLDPLALVSGAEAVQYAVFLT